MKLQFIDINFIDAPKWDESKHPRGKSGEHGGQFVKKGMGGGPAVPQQAKVNLPKYVESHLKQGTPLHEIAEKLVGATKEHINKDYVKKIFGQLEKKHGLPKGSLTHKPGYKPVAKPTPTPAPKPTPTPSPQPGYKADLSDAAWYHPTKSWMANIDNQLKWAASVPPLVTANRIKLIAKLHSSDAQAVKYAGAMLDDLEMKHGVPKGTYNTPDWKAAGAPPKVVDPSTLPKPYDTPHQHALYAIATDPNKSLVEKIDAITNYPTVVNYPGQFAAKYAEQLVTAMGGTWQPKQQATPTPSPTPAKPTPTPQPISTPAILKPLKPTKQWHKDQETFNKANGAVNDHWDSKDAAKHFKSAEPGEFDKYSGAAKSAIKYYTGPGSGSINDALRDPAANTSTKLTDQIHAIYEAFDEPQSETKTDVKIWRGTNLKKEEFNKWKAGLNSGMPTKPTLDGFTSASFYSDHPHFSHMPYWLEICVRKGTPSIAAAKGSGHNEGEILLQHGQQYQVLEIEENYKTKGHGTKTRIRLITI